jgi:hypothetical protein
MRNANAAPVMLAIGPEGMYLRRRQTYEAGPMECIRGTLTGEAAITEVGCLTKLEPQQWEKVEE